jgi:predicted  nucleic acid-binding Zn-ribbon protein
MATKTVSRRKKLSDNKEKRVHKTSDFTEIPKLDFKVKLFIDNKNEATVEQKLLALLQLQLIDSQIDKIKTIRGELPMEVADLEDEVAGLQTRINNLAEEARQIQEQIAMKKQAIKEANQMIKKYQAQQSNVKNNREFESLNKEIEFQHLEIQLAEKRIKEYIAENNNKVSAIEQAQQLLNERINDLKEKKSELSGLVEETQKEEESLMESAAQAASIIEDRLLNAYRRIRGNARNGLAVVAVERDACGGCFNKIPPQRQIELRQRKKIIVCEHCGRILIDNKLVELLKGAPQEA